MHRLDALVALCFLLILVTTSNAQPTSIPAGARVRVAFASENLKDTRRRTIQGALVAADDTSLVVRPRGYGAKPQLIPVRPTLRLELHDGHRGSKAGRGALAGLIAGSVIGFAIGAAADTECQCRVAFGAAAGLVVGIGGVFIGAAAGSTMPRDLWRPVPLPVQVEPPPSD